MGRFRIFGRPAKMTGGEFLRAELFTPRWSGFAYGHGVNLQRAALAALRGMRPNSRPAPSSLSAW